MSFWYLLLEIDVSVYESMRSLIFMRVSRRSVGWTGRRIDRVRPKCLLLHQGKGPVVLVLSCASEV